MSLSAAPQHYATCRDSQLWTGVPTHSCEIMDWEGEEGDITVSSREDLSSSHFAFSIWSYLYFRHYHHIPHQYYQTGCFFELTHCFDILTAYTKKYISFITVNKPINQVIFMLVTEPLLALVPSSLLPSLLTQWKLRLSWYYWGTLGMHCLPSTPENGSNQPPSQVVIWCNGPLSTFYRFSESAFC